RWSAERRLRDRRAGRVVLLQHRDHHHQRQWRHGRRREQRRYGLQRRRQQQHRCLRLALLTAAMTNRLRDLVMTDLFVAPDHVEYRERGGGNAPRLSMPTEYMDDIEAIRAKCAEIVAQQHVTEFSLQHDNIMYRVGVMEDVDFRRIFVLNRAGGTLPDIATLGLSDNILKLLRDPNASGLVI